MTARAAVPPSVAGSCPMGCGNTLFLGDGGHVTCSWFECPDPSAATVILADDESEHVVTFNARGFTIRHPLRERLGDALMRCTLHDEMRHRDGPPPFPAARALNVAADAYGDSGWILTPLERSPL